MLTQISNGLNAVKRLQRLGLLENPFAPYPDARYFYPCTEHARLYQDVLRLAVDSGGKRLGLVMGAEGTGKTILARRLANAFFAQGSVPLKGVLVSGDVSSETVLVRKINDSLELDTRKSLSARLKLLRNDVEQSTRRGQGLMIVIDANLSTAIYNTLLEILSWADQLMVRAVVFSSDNLFAVESKKPALKEMVGVRHTLGSLNYASAAALIEHRVRMAGRSAPLFSTDALNELVDIAQGHPGAMIDLANAAFSILQQGNESVIHLPDVMAARKEIAEHSRKDQPEETNI